MALNIAIASVVIVAGAFFWLPRVRGSVVWLAMMTPLASIIGSGFLVLGPILDASYGLYAPAVMAGLCIVAYLFGAAIRFNIAVIEREDGKRSRLEGHLERIASWALTFAYVISVAYYLNLLGAFGVSLTSFNDSLYARMLTTVVFVAILAVGWTRGFRMLEQLEYASVTTKLAIIAGLLVGLSVFFAGKAGDGSLVLNPPRQTGWQALTLAFGLIITVQGFETSRYLGATYDSVMRIRSMRRAQWLSAAIYMVYIGLIAYVFERGQIRFSETGIVDMMAVVAPILPVILVAAALAAQFSAAVADTSGSGGLAVELTRTRVSARQAYLALTIVGLALTWTADIFEIINYASRAFAFYYMLQSAIAATAAWRRPGDRFKAVPFALLAVLGALIVLFGQPVETQPG